MKKLSISGPSNQYTMLSNAFIDQYMLEANGEFVKVYILLLRKLTSQATDLSIRYLADQLNLTESDIIRALKYWHLKNTLSLTIVEDEITGVQLHTPAQGPVVEESAVTLPKTTIEESVLPDETPLQEDFLIASSSDEQISPTSQQKPQYSNDQLLAFKEQEDYEMLIMVAEKFLGQLSQPDLSTLISFHEWLNLPMDVIYILMEYCASNNKKRMRYIEKVALDWAEQNITTVEKAKFQTEKVNKYYYTIKKALGLGDFHPVPHEMKLMDKWLLTYLFDIEVILEACNKTMQYAPKGGFKYTDTILEKWHKQGVKSLMDVTKLDQDYNTKKTQKDAENKSKPKTTVKKNKFTDYNQRTYDFDSIEKKMLEMRLKGTSKGSYR